MTGPLHVAVRVLHILGMVVLLGGAGVLWYAARRGERAAGSDDTVVSLAGAYEWAFWGALGVLVLTGVGNLGALGAPRPDTRWGTILIAKLSLVVLFVLGSLVRTLIVALADIERADDSDNALAVPFYRRAYGATTTVLLALVVVAEVLAHG
ncbi:CopD family protein [Halorubrum sp. FL23]|uniref:CopD family protein n=1 Tax=Halorubrum sp. FL23 TaxID=3458704 RepID=UPI0040335F76